LLKPSIFEDAEIVTDTTRVILVAPETPGFDESEALYALTAGTEPIRLLVRLAEPPGPALLKAVSDTGIPTEFLIGPTVDAPEGGALVARMPPGTTAMDLDEFALVLSDAVLAEPEAAETTLVHRAKQLGKAIVAPGTYLTAVRPQASVMRRLDPEQRGWHALGRSFFGRIEQGLIEALAFNWLGRKGGGLQESCHRLGRCVRRHWRPSAYFAPEQEARERSLDRGAHDATAPIVARFAALDRCAVHGSYIHRDLIWLMHIGAALAVLFAVQGHLSGSLVGWGVAELFALGFVGLLVFVARFGCSRSGGPPAALVPSSCGSRECACRCSLCHPP
jgi:hypothetical protein